METARIGAVAGISAIAGASVVGVLWWWQKRKEEKVFGRPRAPSQPKSPRTPTRKPFESLSKVKSQEQIVVAESSGLTVGAFGPRRSVTVLVPATSANLGSGFDCLGMALDMWNELTLERADKFSITAEGEGADDVPLDESNLVVVGVKAAFKALDLDLPILKYSLRLRIPHGRGLGSSSAAIVAGLLAGLALTGRSMEGSSEASNEELLQLATAIEGHPDNVAPAIYGGVQLGIFSSFEGRWMTQRVPIPHGLIFVMFIPKSVGKTEELRKVVPKTVKLQDAIHNMGRIAWLINALLTGKTNYLREGFEDRLHQRQRGDAVYHHLYPLIDAAYEAGAVGAYLSGAGPSVMAVCTGGSGDFFTQRNSGRKDSQVAEAMTKVAQDMKCDGKVFITHPSQCGGVVVAADPPYSNDIIMYNGET
jgi:homoserine kinase